MTGGEGGEESAAASAKRGKGGSIGGGGTELFVVRVQSVWARLLEPDTAGVTRAERLRAAAGEAGGASLAATGAGEALTKAGFASEASLAAEIKSNGELLAAAV